MESALLVMLAMDLVPIAVGLISSAVRSGAARKAKKAE